MGLTQANRPAAIFTPLGEDVLLFQNMAAKEELGRLFEFDLDLVSENYNINISDILGQNITVRLALPLGGTRYFNGYVSRFHQTTNDGRLAHYQATVHPWFWFLTRTSDCRIFQEMTVPDIIKEVFRKHGFSDFEELFSNTYRTWEYCVQYRETDFNFVSRLMEQEGIYYYFKHEDTKHTLVLSDAYSSHELILDYESIPYISPSDSSVRDTERVSKWEISQQIQSGTYTLDDYDPIKPKVDLTVRSANPREHAQAEYEIFDYPGEYVETSEGDNYANIRIQELLAQHERLHGQSNAQGITTGGLFELTNHPIDKQNREYLVVSATHYLQVGSYESHDSEEGSVYSCSLVSIDAQTPYRSPRITPKPVVQGPQTAVVVGKDGEEIWTDEHGRVKLQFHWDRAEDVAGEERSCWIRVSQVHAGKGFGGIDIPRIGEEVIVDFLEGDPDRPIVTGRVYNGINKPPNGLPSAGMVSGLKSNSTPGGGGNNAMMLNDTKGKEAVTIHAQYDMNTTVENDQTNTVNNKLTETIKSDATITITKGNYNHDIATGKADYHVQSAIDEKYDATQKTTVKGDITVKSTGGAISVSSDSKHIKIDAATKITLHTGASTIEMDSGGNIMIKGVNVTIKGSASVTTKGAMITSEADAKHQTKGAIVVSEGSATNTVKGGTVLLNP